MNKGVFTLIGYLLFLIGMLSLILSLIGLKLSFLSWIDAKPIMGLAIKLALVMFGLIFMYLAKIRSEEE